MIGNELYSSRRSASIMIEFKHFFTERVKSPTVRVGPTGPCFIIMNKHILFPNFPRKK